MTEGHQPTRVPKICVNTCWPRSGSGSLCQLAGPRSPLAPDPALLFKFRMVGPVALRPVIPR